MLTERTVATDHRRERTSERRGACGCCERGGASNTRGAGPLSECGLSGQSRRNDRRERTSEAYVGEAPLQECRRVDSRNESTPRANGEAYVGEAPLQECRRVDSRNESTPRANGEWRQVAWVGPASEC